MDVNKDSTPTLDDISDTVIPVVPVVKATTDTTDTTVDTSKTSTDNSTDDTNTTNDTKTDTSDTDAILIDGIQYTLDSNGNALNEDKTIKFTKTQIDEFDNSSNPPLIDIETITKHVNFTPLDEQGNPINYDSTPEGVANFVNDAVTQRVPELVDEYLQQQFAANPELAKAVDYINRYGSLAGIESNVDYSDVDITTATEETLYNMIVAKEMANGESLADAKETANLYKDAKKLAERATKSKEYFIAKNANEKASAIEQAKVKQVEVQNYWNNIKDTITNRKLTIGNEQITIPPVIKVKTGEGKTENRTPEDFFAYISVPKTFDIDGQKYNYTQSQYDELMERKSHTVHNEIFEALKRFTKYNNEQFIRDTKKAKETKSIRTITTSTKGNTTTGKTARLE